MTCLVPVVCFFFFFFFFRGPRCAPPPEAREMNVANRLTALISRYGKSPTAQREAVIEGKGGWVGLRW